MSKKYNKSYEIIINGEPKEFRLSAGTLLKLKRAGIDVANKEQMGDIDNALQFIYFGLVNKDEYASFEEMADDIELSELNAILKKVGEIAGGVNSKKLAFTRELSYEELLEYTYGLCNLTPSDLDMDLNDFLEFLYARYMYREHERDNNLQWYSWFTANVMLSSGNYKKNTRAKKLNDSIYRPLDERIKQAQKEQNKKTKEYQEEQKEKLEKIFGIKMGEGF